MIKLTPRLRINVRRTLVTRVEAILRRFTLPHSRTLATTFTQAQSRRGTTDRIRVFSPFFWSEFVERGRRPQARRDGRYYAWFRNPLRDDPRLRQGYPVRRSDVRKLTKREFERGLENETLILARQTRGVNAADIEPRAEPDIIAEVQETVGEELSRGFNEQLRKRLRRVPSRVRARI